MLFREDGLDFGHGSPRLAPRPGRQGRKAHVAAFLGRLEGKLRQFAVVRQIAFENRLPSLGVVAKFDAVLAHAPVRNVLSREHGESGQREDLSVVACHEVREVRLPQAPFAVPYRVGVAVEGVCRTLLAALLAGERVDLPLLEAYAAPLRLRRKFRRRRRFTPCPIIP